VRLRKEFDVPEWTIGEVLDTVAQVVPHRVMTVCGSRRTTFADGARRTRLFAEFLTDNGLGLHTERTELARWECGQDRVALIMRNHHYLEALIGCTKARVVPVNVNYNYSAQEIKQLLEYVQPRGVIYDQALGPLVAESLPRGADLLVAVEDGSAAPLLPGAIAFDDAIDSGVDHNDVFGSPDDLIMMCTGGTTGRPKGVLWRQSDMYVAAMGGADHASAEVIGELAMAGGQVWFAVSPLMHALGVFSALAAVLGGNTVVLYDDRAKFDAGAVLNIVEQEKVSMMCVVGDAYVGPLVAAMKQQRHDLSSLRGLVTGGAATNSVHKQALFECLPHLMIIDGYGSSETGGVGYGRSERDIRTSTFSLGSGSTVLSADRTSHLPPGSEEVGWAARADRVPLGYFGDREATESTFPEIDGTRFSIPGDRACIAPDGSLRLLGRDSLVINTGGEKVFVEEVEEALRSHPAVSDALVVGRPSPRWGQEIVALVSLKQDGRVTPEQLRSHCKTVLAGYKAPKQTFFVEQVQRLGNGKPDYQWAIRHARAQTVTTSAPHARQSPSADEGTR
jgi:fatty-acyl-CoA synthase